MRVALVVATVLLTAAPARADVTIGSALPAPSGGPLACAGGCTYSSTAIDGHPTIAPSPGVITRWRIRAGGQVGGVRLVVVRRPSGPGNAAGELVGRSALRSPTANTVTEFAARIPILAGDYIGIEPEANVPAEYFADVATSKTDDWSPPLTAGASALPAHFDVPREVLVNAAMQPDADTDGFGDETQDNCVGTANDDQADRDHDGVGDACDPCPATAGQVNGCPAPPAPPPPAPNQPPVVRFRAPLSGTGVGPSVAIELDVADDSGAPVVSVFDDDGTICVLQAAPYSCTWRPTGADVGRATLLASAVDSGGLSTLGIVRVRVNRFHARLTKTAKRRRGRVRVTGRLVLPAVVTRAQGCSGKVTVQVRKVRRTVELGSRCTYAATLRVRAGRPRVRFAGNSVIAPT